MNIMPEVNWTYRAAPLRVVDGDTIVLLIDNGFRNHEEHSIRLLGVNTPEIFSGTDDEKAAGQEAKSKVEGWISSASVAASPSTLPLIVQTEKNRMSFNRYLGMVWSLDGQCLNDWLIEQGYGA